MPVTSAEARRDAIQKQRERLSDNAPEGTRISGGTVHSVEKRNETRRLYNSLTIDRDPCSTVWEHWIVRYEVSYHIRFKVVLPDGRTAEVALRSRWYSVEEWDMVTYLDCPPGMEDLKSIPENYCSLTVDGVTVWSGTAVTMHGGVLADTEATALLQAIARDTPPEEEREQA